jgi:CheY-like chemotaxis protein
MTMPQMTGDELAQKLLNIKPDIPVILCTGFNEDITEEKALSMGIQKFVMKPVIKNDLATTIRTVLDHN